MIGSRISHYTILEKIGEGGMGVVYKAHDTKLDRLVALKFLPDRVTSSPADIARFQTEARAISALNHPAIATIFEIDEVDEKKFIALEFIAGGTLKSRLRKLKAEDREFPIDDVIDYGIQIAEGLAHAHRHEIIHRDIKSDNMMLTDEGKVKITDFGLAKLRGTPQMTKTGSTIGTLAYMAPEQVQGEDIDRRADLFSLGAVLYELTTSRLPFNGEHEAALIYSLVNENPGPMKSLRPNVPPELETIITRCLQKDRTRRYQTADEIVADLRTLQREMTAPMKSVVQRKLPKPIWVGTGVTLVLLAVAIVLFLPASPSDAANSKTVAVLPFSNMSGNPDDEYFSDGMTEDILTQLAKISDLKVISRTTMMQFKGSKKSTREIGKELHAGVVLEGSVRRAGDQIRISAQLIDANTDEHIWAETYDKEYTQVFAIQSDVAQKIARALKARLSPTEKERIEKQPTASTAAYTLYLKGRSYWIQRSSTAMPIALKYFQDATGEDPRYALAWAGIADCYSAGNGFYFDMPPREALEKAQSAVDKALEIDSSLAEVYTSLGAVQTSRWDWNGSETSFLRAIKLNPSYATAHQWYAELLASLGRFDEAQVEFDRALELDPLSMIINSAVAWLPLAKRDPDEALAISHRILATEPGFLDALQCQAQAMIVAKRPESEIFLAQLASDSVGVPLNPEECGMLRQAFRKGGMNGFWRTRLEVLHEQDRRSILAWQGFLVETYAQLGDSKHAIDVLRKMCAARDPLLYLIKVWVYFDPLRSNPGFQEIIRQMNLPG